MKLRILLCIFVNINIFVTSSTFCCDCFEIQVTQKDANMNNSTMWDCINKNIGEFWNIALDWPTFRIPRKYDIKDKDVLFYAECITGALACVLKNDRKIPSNFEFDIINTNDSEWRFLKNVKKLMQAYKDTFIKEQNKMNVLYNNKKNKAENSKEELYNQEEEKCKLKQD